MREYELTIVIQPEISEEGSQAILARLDEILEGGDSVRLLCDDLGKRKLAYEIRKFHKGHYYLLSFLDEGSVIPGLERVLRLEESVLRFLTVKTSDLITDIEARKVWAKEREIELKKRAEERAARDAEEAKARAEAERLATERAAERAAAEQAAAEKAAAEQAASEKAAAEQADGVAAEAGEGAAEAVADASGDAEPSTSAEDSTSQDAPAADDETSAADVAEEAEKETS